MESLQESVGILIAGPHHNLKLPQVCDRYHQIHADSYKWFDIAFDHFGRTSTPEQTKCVPTVSWKQSLTLRRVAQEIFMKLYKNGHLDEKSTPQLYCETFSKFLADRFVEGTCPICGYEDARGDQCDMCTNQLDPVELKSPRCKLCKEPPVVKTSTHLFIKLKDMQPEIEDFVTKAISNGVWSENAKAMTRAWLKGGLEPRAMTRDLQWGVPVPIKGYENKVMYVWFDAPIGYPSITSCYTEEWERWWKDEENVQLVQFMGKDNGELDALFEPVRSPCSPLPYPAVPGIPDWNKRSMGQAAFHQHHR
jgi:methionyl-tRNA synthetase